MTASLTTQGGPDVSPRAFTGTVSRASPANGVACMDIMRYLSQRRGSYCLLTTGMQYSHVGVGGTCKCHHSVEISRKDCETWPVSTISTQRGMIPGRYVACICLIARKVCGDRQH